jgi:HAD superfamily hydrolase (TIGR01549 family)
MERTAETDLERLRHWVFDLDGTLTVAAHDFDAIREALGIEEGRPILEALAALPASERDSKLDQLDEIELSVARAAIPQEGAADLLECLARRGARLAILTRNSKDNAIETLRACGLEGYFEPAAVMGRDEAEPKPSPDGIEHALARWQVAPDDAAMVGDYLYDLQAARAAGCIAIYFDPAAEFAWSEHADHCTSRLVNLIGSIQAGGDAKGTAEASRWYASGLRFACTRCGRCCSAPSGSVFVSDAEIERLALRLSLSAAEFRARFTRTGPRGRVRLAEAKSRDCIFYDRDAGCTVHTDRPKQCRTWPFWGANIHAADVWDSVAEDCPGIGRGGLHDSGTIRGIEDGDGVAR